MADAGSVIQNAVRNGCLFMSEQMVVAVNLVHNKLAL
jgi:hypothetical protein